MNCPICKKPIDALAAQRNEASPFCSNRCKLIDLGRWLDERYQIPVDPAENEKGNANQPQSRRGAEEEA